ncbi:hypothetical protein DNTS_030096 [Danionella cerebrum]|uniref:Striatin N-terminal domain-containing protein n=1 Tax=Danionella cerebrum TaxID=2873325 RepID=A0A553Q1Q8_9TELE|nr:hypothetical protein DNTS_030096 [Danionella translucida]TRY83871.1 hypothetical protein DNTS_030096 [Danionella translucida]
MKATGRNKDSKRSVGFLFTGSAMDEQAGPGVFFNNNNNNPLLPGGGSRAAHPSEGGGEAGRAHYSIPGILHFLQHEWARFELERAQWELERAELQAQIAFLQGERKGQENLKKDLVRRIKMLEYALKQERAKFHKLKYGTELNQGEMKPPSYDSDDGNENEALPEPANSQLSWKQGRQLLRQYLQEVGYTDTILDVKSQRVKALLGLTGDNPEREHSQSLPDEPMVNGTEPTISKPEMSDSAAVLEAFKFIEKAAAELSDEDDDEDSDTQNKSIVDLATMVRRKSSPSSSSSAEMSDDLDTDEVMKGFDFLANSEDMECLSDAAPSADWGPNRCKLQDMLANLRDAEDLSSVQPPVVQPARPRLPEHTLRTDEVEALTFPASPGKPFILGPDETLDSDLGLGELAGLTVANEAESPAYEMSSNQDALRKTWNPKFTLRNHFDSIRGLAFHPQEPVLITASEDHTLKMWNLQKTAPNKKGPVMCVVFSSSGEQCFSGGLDGSIQSWNTPDPNIDPYDSYEPSVLRGALSGHTDAVWGLVYSSAHHTLLSCSADGTVRLWDAAETAPAIAVFNQNGELGVPSSVDMVSSDPAHMVTSFTNGRTGIYNMETHQLILELESQTAGKPGKLIHSMVAHLDAVTSLAVDPNGLYLMSGSHDCSVRLWNMESKTCIQEFTAHRKKFDESIHDVAFHPSRCFIGSAGADALAKVFV